MTVTTHQVHFTVDGGGITDLARNLMLSERPDAAWRIIAHGLIGEGSHETAEGVLSGTLRLVNAEDDALGVEKDDDAERYLRDLKYIYAGRIRMDGTWYRPCAVIEHYGPKSAGWASKSIPPREARDQDHPGRVLRRWSDRRAEFFCDRGERVILSESERNYVVWETCGERPFWWDPNLTPEAAITEAREAGRRFEVRGENVSNDTIIEAIEEEDDPEPEELDALRALANEARAIKRQADYEAHCREIGEKVRKQAGNDTFKLTVPATDGSDFREPTPERVITVPRAPFWCWALGRAKSLNHLMPEWETVSASGLKLPLDNPYHSDWMLGAGLDLCKDYGVNNPVTQASWDEMHRIQRMLGDYEVTVLVDGGLVSGTVGKEIAVLPNLSQKYTEVAMQSKAIIAERGGALAHLSVVGMEMGLTVVRDPDALVKYPEGTVLTVDPNVGTVKRHGPEGNPDA